MTLKFWIDDSPYNDEIASEVGISLRTLNDYERRFLFALNYSLVIHKEQLDAFNQQLVLLVAQ